MRELKIVHRSRALDRFRRGALSTLDRFVENRIAADAITAGVNRAVNLKVGDNFEQVTEWFKDGPFTGSEVASAWQTGQDENEDVTSLWGMIQVLTAHARTLPYTNWRVNLERRAEALLGK